MSKGAKRKRKERDWKPTSKQKNMILAKLKSKNLTPDSDMRDIEKCFSGCVTPKACMRIFRHL